jgi:cardiolipin synthase (CMP-forming)
MKFSQLLTAPNQLTLLRMMFVPFIVIDLVAGHYKWALILFVLAGFSDGLDGLLARTLKQQTVLGQYLDPIADKLLLSTMFMVLAILHKIAWKYTVLVFSRDISILFASIFGKANTFAQVAAVFFVMLYQVRHDRWVWITQTTFLHATVAFTVVSALHYVLLVGQRLRTGGGHVAAETTSARSAI